MGFSSWCVEIIDGDPQNIDVRVSFIFFRTSDQVETSACVVYCRTEINWRFLVINFSDWLIVSLQLHLIANVNLIVSRECLVIPSTMTFE